MSEAEKKYNEAMETMYTTLQTFYNTAIRHTSGDGELIYICESCRDNAEAIKEAMALGVDDDSCSLEQYAGMKWLYCHCLDVAGICEKKLQRIRHD